MRERWVWGMFLGVGVWFLLSGAGLCVDKITLKDGSVYEGKLIGRSDRRFLFAIDAGGMPIEVSFFKEDVATTEWDEETKNKEVPYLKEVESLKVSVDEGQAQTYEISLYKDGPRQGAPEGQALSFSDKDLKKALSAEEMEYHDKFNGILKQYMDKFAAIQDIYANITTASKEDFQTAKQYMDDLYFELNNLVVPALFMKTHRAYLESVKASFLAFNALDQGMLDEAQKQFKISEESKTRSMAESRTLITGKLAALPKESKDTPPPASPPASQDEAENPQ